MVWNVLLWILIILVLVLVVLFFFGRKQQKKQAETADQLEAMKQSISVLVIDKKLLPLKRSGLPQQVIDQTPWYLRRNKMPIVKAKVGPRIMTMVADRAVFDVLPVKAECKIECSGIYITGIKSVRGGKLETPPKKSWWGRQMDKVRNVASKNK